MSRIPSKIGKYQIEEKIAEGGMGAVFRGTHPTLDKPVVLKKLTLSHNEHLIERFRREAKIMMEFSNENIVRVYDHFKNASAFYIVQELVDGKSVDLLLKKERYLRYEEALYIFYYACKALDYAHSNQVVHRDIKPANIIVSRNGEIKLVDFGIASSEEEEESLTKEGMALGTPSYMAPEQYDDSRTVTYKADIYSLGIMLYEMVTGKKPFPGKMNPDTLMKIQKGKFTAVRKINPTLPSSVNWYIRKSIQAKPQKRAESVKVLLKRLEKWFQTADIQGIRENLIRLVNDQERQPVKTKRKRVTVKWAFWPLMFICLAGAAGFLYFTGFHYRTFYASDYGGFRLIYEVPEPLRPAETYHMTATVYNDNGGSIGDTKVMSFKLSPRQSEDSLRMVSRALFTKPGSYWIKTACDEKVWWKNIFIPPFTDKSFLLSPGEVETFLLDPVSEKQKQLRVVFEVVDRTNGLDLSDKFTVSVQAAGRPYRPYREIENELLTGRAYNFKIEAEGYYPLNYDLGIKTHQDVLTLDAELIPKEGYLWFKSAQELPENLEILINGKRQVVQGGRNGGFLDTSEFTKLKRQPLLPGSYSVEIRSGRVSTRRDISIKSGDDTVLIINLEMEKNKVNTISADDPAGSRQNEGDKS